MMDEEGFPVVGFPARRNIAEDSLLRVPMVADGYPEDQNEAAIDRASGYVRLPCRESGEAAFHPVLVFRRPPERVRSGVSEGGRRRFRIDEVRKTSQTTMETEESRRMLEESRRMLEMEFPALFMSPELYPMGDERLHRVLHIPTSQGCLCNDPACPVSLTDPACPLSLAAATPIKAGAANSQKERKKQVRVTVFNELVYGEKIFDHRNDDDQGVLKKLVMLRIVPFIVFQLIYNALLHLWQCVPYLHFLGFLGHVYRHVRIHQVGDEKGIEPVFTGTVYNGPLIYAIRIYKCPYCKHKAEAKLFQQYVDSTYRERRAAAVAESGKNEPA